MENYESMKVAELRNLIVSKKLAYGKCVAFANKENCIKLLTDRSDLAAA